MENKNIIINIDCYNCYSCCCNGLIMFNPIHAKQPNN